MNWLYLSWLAGIPCAWYCVNQARARISKYRNIKRFNEIYMPKSASVREVPEVQTYCAGCDQIVPESWMAWLDADNDGVIGELYRCRVCRGVLDLDPVASQKARNERMGIGPGLIINIDQMAHEQMVGRWQEQDFEALRGDDSLDLSQLLAPEYTAAVEHYRSHDVDATNETDRIYRDRIAKRAQRRQAELRAKYRMDSGEWRNNVKRNGHWEWTGMGKEWVND